MQAIRTDFQPINRITTPLAGTPSYINSGIIKAVMKNGDKVSVAQIDYQEFDEENFQYVISPYWEIVDGLPASVFQGIPGIAVSPHGRIFTVCYSGGHDENGENYVVLWFSDDRGVTWNPPVAVVDPEPADIRAFDAVPWFAPVKCTPKVGHNF